MEAENKQYRWIEWDGSVRYVGDEEYRLIRASTEQILLELDQLVKDPSSQTYQYIKSELAIRTRIKDNPFAAGRPKKYGQEAADKVHALRKEGKTLREIARLTNMSLGTVSVISRNVQK